MKLPNLPLQFLERAIQRQAPRCIRHFSSQQATPTPRWGNRRKYATIAARDLLFGQPVYETHPNLLKPGEITPGITAQEYHERRARLAAQLPPNSAVLLPAAPVLYRSGAVFYPHRQDSNFIYLTGFLEPQSFALILSHDAGEDYTFILFCRPKDPRAEQWNGPWSGIEAARDVFNADAAYDISRLDSEIPRILREQSVKKIFTDAPLSQRGAPTDLGELLKTASSTTPSLSATTSSLRQVLNPIRAIKSPAEIACMRRAGQGSGRALTNAMRQSWPTEKHLASFLEYEYHQQGLDGSAYIPVVAGGSRGNLIHYTQNKAPIFQDDFILVDAGGEYGTYITDITRTWPASGRFTAAQRDLYNAVLKVQRTGVSLCTRASNMTLDKIHVITEGALREQLKLLGFDTSGNAMDVLFPHHVGHYIGLDVHDVPGYGRGAKLENGHCVTVEPGVYVPDDERWPKHFRGMGVRIEDSVCVDEESPYVLTTEAVKEIDDIEALRN